MKEVMKDIFHPLKPYSKIPGDWCNLQIPGNIEVGENTVLDSSFCFNNFYSKRTPGLKIGSNVTFWRTSFSVEENGFIEVGDYSYIMNASLVCSQYIHIGKYVMISGGVTIVDSDFHPVSPARRIEDTIALSPVGIRTKKQKIITMPVTIGDDVWIGFNATILKGVSIGKGAIIQPGAVVTKDVSEGTVVAGNPATLISEERL